MTEDEAKTQQCIGPRNCGRLVQTGSLNPDNFPRFCIGSACKMAWRWIDFGCYGTTNEPIPSTQGYCGLAGEP